MAYKAVDGDGLIKFFQSLNSGADSANALLPQVNVTNFPQALLGANLNFVTGTVATSGDNLIVDISALPGYIAGSSIHLYYLLLQNEAQGQPVSVLYKADTTLLGRGRLVEDGEGIALMHPIKMPADADLLLNLSDAVTVGYTVHYVLESP